MQWHLLWDRQRLRGCGECCEHAVDINMPGSELQWVRGKRRNARGCLLCAMKTAKMRSVIARQLRAWTSIAAQLTRRAMSRTRPTSGIAPNWCVVAARSE